MLSLHILSCSCINMRNLGKYTLQKVLFMVLLQHETYCISNSISSTSGTNLIPWTKFSEDIKTFFFFWRRMYSTLLLRKADRCALKAGVSTLLQERYISQSGITLGEGRPLSLCTCYSSVASGVSIIWKKKKLAMTLHGKVPEQFQPLSLVEKD